MHAVFPRFPGQIKGINGDAMPPQTRPWVIGHKSKGFGGRSSNHLIEINPHLISKGLEFIHQANVHGPVNILQQLGHLSGPGAAHRNHLTDRLLIQRHPNFTAG